ncbi:hypothetical protein [Phaeodactylibacter luteus]|uniref:Uncharacterized protein n=1 Tax=Phaeodactylibacter luteus TaxID=1564516 RepID=A0A5C6RG33_9BACT|nr:hypothetical protein [Phaeodactylibacter luteus]TXB61286.1 hypothetical protein FRY97_19835 [Phaeodactylibacter luteus]
MRTFFAALLGMALFSAGLHAQAEQQIREQLQAYFEATESKDWAAVTDLLYPPLFELVPKADMIQMFEDMEGNGMVFNMQDFKAQAISEVFRYEGEAFAKVDYIGRMSLQFTSEAMQTPEMTGMMKGNLEAQYGLDMVEHDPKSHTFTIKLNKSLLAVSPEGAGTWSFIEAEDSAGTLQQVLPAAVLRHFRG